MGYVEKPLGGKFSHLCFQVDEADWPLVSQYRWLHGKHVRGLTSYARVSMKVEGRWRVVYMHRLIMGERPGADIDHIDGNGLNNRRANLRFVTRSQNVTASLKRRGKQARVRRSKYVAVDGTLRVYVYPVSGTKRGRKLQTGAPKTCKPGIVESG